MKGCKFYIGMMLLLVAGLPVGCSRDAEPTMQHEIAVTTGVSGMQKRVVAINDDATLRTKDIKIDAYFHGTETKYLNEAMLVYETDHWRFDNGFGTELHYYWPIEGSVYTPAVGDPITVSSLDFVGICPFTRPGYITADPTYNHSTGISFACNMGSYMTLASQTSMREFLVAVSPEQTIATQTEHNGVPLQFKHPFAIIKFVINAASGTHVRIDSIGIDGLHTTGTCTYDGTDMTWTLLSGDADMSLDGVNLTVAGTMETDTIFVIPDTYDTHLKVKCTWTEWSNVTISDYGTDISFDWEPGHSYIYNLTVDKYGLKVDVQKYTEQW